MQGAVGFEGFEAHKPLPVLGVASGALGLLDYSSSSTHIDIHYCCIACAALLCAVPEIP